MSESIIEKARSEETPQSELLSIWKETKSVKIKRILAANANACPELLKAAAVKYLNIVLENPAFKFYGLFGNNIWIKTVYSCYFDPDRLSEHLIEYLGATDTRGWIGHMFMADTENVCDWACLLSPKLSLVNFDEILYAISEDQFKRALKNKEAKGRIKELAHKALYGSALLNDYDLRPHSVLKLYNGDVVDLDYLNSALSHYSLASTWSGGGSFRNSVLKMLREHTSLPEEKKLLTPTVLSKLFLTSSLHLQHELKIVLVSEKMTKVIVEEVIVKAYKMMHRLVKEKAILKEHSKLLKGIISDFILLKKIAGFSAVQNLEQVIGGLDKLYAYLQQQGLTEVGFVPAWVVNTLQTAVWPTKLTDKRGDIDEVLKDLDPVAKKYFINNISIFKLGPLPPWDPNKLNLEEEVLIIDEPMKNRLVYNDEQTEESENRNYLPEWNKVFERQNSSRPPRSIEEMLAVGT
jgi:hypothetical protein